MLKSSLCGYSDAYILVKGTISFVGQAGDNPNNNNKKVVSQNCAPFTDFISEINNTQIDFFFYICFLSRAFTIHRTAGEGGGYLFNFSLPLPPALRTLRH